MDAVKKVIEAWHAMPHDDPILPAGIRSEWHAWKLRMNRAVEFLEKETQAKQDVQEAAKRGFES